MVAHRTKEVTVAWEGQDEGPGQVQLLVAFSDWFTENVNWNNKTFQTFSMFIILFLGSTKMDLHASMFQKTHYFSHTVHFYLLSVWNTIAPVSFYPLSQWDWSARWAIRIVSWHWIILYQRKRAWIPTWRLRQLRTVVSVGASYSFWCVLWAL